jgi:hypothetical protein
MVLASTEQADNGIPLPHPDDHDPVPAHRAAAVQVWLLSAEQAQQSPHPTQVSDLVCPVYDNLPALQAAPPFHDIYDAPLHHPAPNNEHQRGHQHSRHRHQPDLHEHVHDEHQRGPHHIHPQAPQHQPEEPVARMLSGMIHTEHLTITEVERALRDR